MTKKIRVLIVDDSPFIREMFTEYLNADPQIEVVGTAEDPHDAREQIKAKHPDVITLDVEMPKMDGLSFLEKIMTLRPMPVVMASSLTQKNADITFRALEIGAVDYVGKPDNPKALRMIRHELVKKVKTAANARLSYRGEKPASSAAPSSSVNTLSYQPSGRNNEKLIAIGASTGGVEAIRAILEAMPANIPPIIITQHMPPHFTKSFADRLNKHVAPIVQEAQTGLEILPGNAYIAAGGYHLSLRKSGDKLACQLDDRPAVSSHKPSVDVMFESVAETCPKRAIAAILTGMGRDGAAGLKKLHDLGVPTFGQDEASCVVYGMPKAAAELGGVARVITLRDMAQTLLEAAK